MHKTQNTGEVAWRGFTGTTVSMNPSEASFRCPLPCAFRLSSLSVQQRREAAGSHSSQGGCEGLGGRGRHSVCGVGCLLVERNGVTLLLQLVKSNPVHARCMCFFASMQLTAMPLASSRHCQSNELALPGKEKMLTSHGSWFLSVIGNKIN